MTHLNDEADFDARRRAGGYAAAVAAIGTVIVTAVSSVITALAPAPVPPVMAGTQQGEAAKLDPLKLEKEPVWATEVDDYTHGFGLESTDLFDDAIVLGSTTTSGGDRAMVGLDRKSGKRLWSLGRDGDLGGGKQLVSSLLPHADGRDRIVVVYEKTDGGEREQGIAALSPRDGEVEWSLALDSSPQYRGDVSIAQIEGRRGLITVSHNDEDFDTTDSKVVAVDFENEEIAWERKDASASMMDEGLAFVSHRGSDSFSALRATDGEKLWDTTDLAGDPQPLGVSSERAVLGMTGGGVVVDAVTGDKVRGFASSIGRCPGTVGELLVCDTGNDSTTDGPVHPTVVDPTASVPAEPCLALDGVTTLTVLGDRVLGTRSDGSGVVFDAHCRAAGGGDYPANLVAADGGHALFSDGDGYSEKVWLYAFAD